MPSRLTDQQRAERAMKEAQLQDLIIAPHGLGLAPLLGWETLHVRPGMRAGGRWWTPTVGSLAKLPDLFLVRTRDRRLIIAELKRELEEPTEEQQRVLDVFAMLAGDYVQRDSGTDTWTTMSIEVYVWRPSDLRDPVADSTIGRILA